MSGRGRRRLGSGPAACAAQGFHERRTGVQRFRGDALRFGFREARGQQLLEPVFQVLGQLVKDFGLARSFELQPGEAFADDVVPIRHNQLL